MCDHQRMQDAERTAQQYDAMSTAYRNHNDGSAANAYYERPATISLIGKVDGLHVLEAAAGQAR